MTRKSSKLPLALMLGAIALVTSIAQFEVRADDGMRVEPEIVELTAPADTSDNAIDLSRATDDARLIDLPEPADDSLQDNLGMGMAPLFESHGVYRTDGANKNSPYFVMGYQSDGMLPEDEDPNDARADNGFSYGFGISDTDSSFEYMMSVDQDNYQTEAVGIRFNSQF